MIKSVAKLCRRSPDPKTTVQVFVDDIGKWKASCLKSLVISRAEKKGPGRKGGMFLSRGGRERAHPIPCSFEAWCGQHVSTKHLMARQAGSVYTFLYLVG